MTLEELNKQISSAEQLFTNQQIQAALLDQAQQIDKQLAACKPTDLPPLILTVMNGGLLYAGQLLPLITTPVQIDYIHATRYRNTTEGHLLDWKVYPQNKLAGRVVVILDDILDEGVTLDSIVQYCRAEQAAQVLSAVMVTKLHDRRDASITADFSAIDVPDRYVFGFGMDYKGHLRNLDGIYALVTH